MGRASVSVQRKLAGRARGLLKWGKSGASQLIARSRVGTFTITREAASFVLTLETPDGRWEELASSAKLEPIKAAAEDRSRR